MKAIILAGGLGTRLREVVSDVPKPMALVGGKPFLEYLVLQLKRQGLHEIVFSIGYKGELISEYFGDGSAWGCCFEYVQEAVPLGTGGAIRETLAKVDEEHALVMNGDSFCGFDLESLLTFHLERRAQVTMNLVRVDDMARYGSVTTNSEGAVAQFREKGDSGLGFINSGIYLVQRDVRERFPVGASSFERDFLPQLIGRGLFAAHTQEFFVDIGVPEDYHFMCEVAESGKLMETLNLP